MLPDGTMAEAAKPDRREEGTRVQARERRNGGMIPGDDP